MVKLNPKWESNAHHKEGPLRNQNEVTWRSKENAAVRPKSKPKRCQMEAKLVPKEAKMEEKAS